MFASDPGKAPRDISGLPEFYQELTYALDQAIAPPHVIHYLENLPMKGKAAKIAKSLLWKS